jgi:hypothetical protein
MRYAPVRMMKIMGVPAAVQKRLCSAERDLLDEIMLAFLPVSRRAAGISNDIRMSNPDLNDLTLAGLTAPTMIIHAVDDPCGSHEGARRLSQTGPVRFLESPAGGHLFNGHLEQVSEARRARGVRGHRCSGNVDRGRPHRRSLPRPGWIRLDQPAEAGEAHQDGRQHVRAGDREADRKDVSRFYGHLEVPQGRMRPRVPAGE